MFFKRKVKEEVYVPPVETKLYLLVEVQKQGLVQYFHENGVEIYFMSQNPDEVIDALLLEEDNMRLVVIDNDRGKFDDKKVLDMIEGVVEIACDIGEVSMFSNTNGFNNIRKKIVSQNKDKNDKINIYKSSGAVDILMHLKTYNEVYTQGGAEDVVPENVLSFTPTYIEREKGDINREIFDVDMDSIDMDESLPRYGRALRNY